MKMPSCNDAFQALLLQAADHGRGERLFGDSLSRLRSILPDFLPEAFPDVYLEFPLAGTPFLDATILYGRKIPKMPVITSSAAEGTQEMLQWFFSVSEEYTDICCGYELDTKTDQLPAAGVHFQPRKHLELVEPFCASLGEAWRAPLYLAAAERLKETWPLSFFGLFRGRPRSPLRVCGYLAREEQDACAKDPDRIENIFHTAGFTAYDQTMVGQVSALLAATPGQADFQFDLYPDGTCGNVFAIDARFDPRPSGEMNSSFAGGENLKLMRLLEAWGITDSRWKQGVETAFTRALPVCLENGETGSFALSLLPQWIKIRWINGRLQPSKLYLLAAAGMV